MKNTNKTGEIICKAVADAKQRAVGRCLQIGKIITAVSICGAVAWGCSWNPGTEGKRKSEFAEYMRVGVRDPDRMKLEWRYATLKPDGKTLMGVVIFWGVNGYGGYDFPSYYHVVVKEGGQVFFREVEGREDVLQDRKELAAYQAEEETALKTRLDAFLEDAEWQLKKLSRLTTPEIPADLEGGDWSKPEEKRKAWNMFREKFDMAKTNERDCFQVFEYALRQAQEEHRDWRLSQEEVYYSKGLGLDVGIDGRTKGLKEQCSAVRAKFAESLAQGEGCLDRVKQRIEAAEQEASTARKRALLGALTAEKEKEAEAKKAAEKEAKAQAASDEENRRRRATAEAKMQALEETAVKFYAENHPTAASKYEIEDYRKNAAQLLLGIHRLTLSVREKRDMLAATKGTVEQEALQQSIAASERRLDDLWQTLLVGIGVSKHTLQLERQSGKIMPRMKKSMIPFIPGNSSFSYYEPYLKELAGEGL